MKKTLTIVFTSLSLIMILDSLNVGEAIAMFFLAGVVPGTNLTISASRMLEAYALIFGFTLSRLTLYAVRQSNARGHLAHKLS